MDTVPKPVFIKHNDIPHDVLSRNQVRVINVIIGRSRCNSTEAVGIIDGILGEGASQILAEYCKTRIMTINFRGDLFEKFMESDHYKSMYEVRKTKCATRNAAEDRVFLDLYKDSPNIERPKYGSLDVHARPGADATCYGSCYFVLAESVRQRVTVTDRDSFGNVEVGVCDWMMHVLAKLQKVELQFIYDIACGKAVTYKWFSYVEIQIHGLLRFSHDFVEVHVPRNSTKKVLSDGKEFAEKCGIKFIIDG